jgi:hypothetical protein
MAALDYTFRLRHRDRDVDKVQPFSRGIDFDLILDADQVLLRLLVAAVRRAGADPRKDLDEYSLEVREFGNGRPLLRTFAASCAEVTDEMVPR